jgi:hypothetical protein
VSASFLPKHWNQDCNVQNEETQADVPLQNIALLFFNFIIFTFTQCVNTLLQCIYIVWAILHLPTSGQNLFHSLVLRFCWRENIRDNKKDIAFLLVWDKDSYIEKILALLSCTCVLQPTLVHLYQTSSLLPSPLPIAASDSLRLQYSLLYSEHINHIQVLGFLLSLFLPYAFSP